MCTGKFNRFHFSSMLSTLWHGMAWKEKRKTIFISHSIKIFKWLLKIGVKWLILSFLLLLLLKSPTNILHISSVLFDIQFVVGFSFILERGKSLNVEFEVNLEFACVKWYCNAKLERKWHALNFHIYVCAARCRELHKFLNKLLSLQLIQNESHRSCT